VTSADVRLSVGVEVFRIAGQIGLTETEATVGGMSSKLHNFFSLDGSKLDVPNHFCAFMN
jgi:hypothetical protein